MSRATFQVLAALDGAGGKRKGTVIIDRAAGTFTVRPYRSRRVYTVPLAEVATTVCRALAQGELARKKREKAAARATKPRRARKAKG